MLRVGRSDLRALGCSERGPLIAEGCFIDPAHRAAEADINYLF